MTAEMPRPNRSLRTSLRQAALTVPAILVLGWISGRIGNSGYANIWFARLDKPAIMPPGWAFGLAWSILYIMMGFALAFILTARESKGRGWAIVLFLTQLVLNLAWSPVFFALHRIMLAFGLIVAIFLWAGATTLVFWHIRRVAALLMLPYLVWLLFAGYLNWRIHELNPWGPALVTTTGNTQIIVQ